jgi:LacI family transcriptional regulator
VRLGHREIATVTGDLNTQAGLDRLDGFVLAMKAAHLPMKDGYIQYGRFRVEEARQAMEALLVLKDRPTAVFVASDEMAIEAINVALAKRVRVPEELSVVGFDDNPIAAHARIPLTTIQQPLKEMGRLGMELLMQQVTGKRKTPSKVLLQTKLIERQSCRQTWLEH